MAEPLDPDAAHRVLRRAGDLADDDHTTDAEMMKVRVSLDTLHRKSDLVRSLLVSEMRATVTAT